MSLTYEPSSGPLHISVKSPDSGDLQYKSRALKGAPIQVLSRPAAAPPPHFGTSIAVHDAFDIHGANGLSFAVVGTNEQKVYSSSLILPFFITLQPRVE